MFDMFISAFSSACSMEALVANFIGVALGIVFGALPGLTAVMGVALLIPLTFGFPAVIAFSALLGMYCGAIYAGSITAILVGTPGTAAAAATMLEGPKFTARGESLKALEMTTIASFIGGIFSCIVLATVAPQLAHFALDFSAPEYFSLGIFGLTIVATLSEGALLKGCIAALLGMLISMIGMDPLSGNLRMTFDSPDLINGVSLVPALVGLYALSQVLVTIEDVFMGRKLSTAEISRKGISLPDLWANRAALIRGSLFGTFIGIVPATGSGTASFAAYSETKRHSKHPELFGKGTLEGIAATESANNAVTGGALIPLLTLGVPGDVVTAIMLGALMIQGMTPGPLLFQEQGTLVYSIFIALQRLHAASGLLRGAPVRQGRAHSRRHPHAPRHHPVRGGRLRPEQLQLRPRRHGRFRVARLHHDQGALPARPPAPRHDPLRDHRNQLPQGAQHLQSGFLRILHPSCLRVVPRHQPLHPVQPALEGMEEVPRRQRRLIPQPL